MAKNLILYYSRRGENYWNGSLRHIAKGNTEIVAEFIQKAVGGDLFEIETVRDYAPDYHACVDQARDELRRRARPELKKTLDRLEGYDNVFLCGPCWCGTYPMAVFTLAEKLNWTGKKVFPVMTHEGSGLCDRELKMACAGASFGKGLSVRGSEAAQSERAVAAWAKSVAG